MGAREAYVAALEDFVFLVRQGAFVKRLVQQDTGDESSNALVETVGRAIKAAKDNFIAAREAVGLSGSLSFLENASFDGFQIKNCGLAGDPEAMFRWAGNYAMPPAELTEESAFKYEVASLILALPLPELVTDTVRIDADGISA